MQLLLIILLLGTMIYITIDTFSKKTHTKWASDIVLNLGIFGTFLGVSIALLSFGGDNIKDSVPQLMGALRFAFITSVFGIGCSLFIKTFVKEQTMDTADNDAMYYHQLQFLEKLYARVDDMHTLMAPNSPQYIMPQGEALILEQLQKMNDHLWALCTIATTEQNASEGAETSMYNSHYQTINNWVEEHLSNSFEKLRRDLSVISTHLSDYPKEIAAFNDSIKVMNETVYAYNQQMRILDQQMEGQATGLQHLSATFEVLNKQSVQFNDLGTKIDNFFMSMNDIIYNVDNRETVKDLAYLRKQYTSELKERLSTIEFTLHNISTIIGQTSKFNKKTKEYV